MLADLRARVRTKLTVNLKTLLVIVLEPKRELQRVWRLVFVVVQVEVK